MNFKEYILSEIAEHPSAQAQDIAKLCYQAAFGAEHGLSNLEAARLYLKKEFDQVEIYNVPLYEYISDDICRVNLSAWKASAMPLEWLFKMFVGSSAVENGDEKLFLEYLEVAEAVTGFSLTEFKANIAPVHHSNVYRENENPAYRIINSRYVRLFPILMKIPAGRQLIIAIDGRAASGKSTAAALLKDILGAEVIHMDDFFLPPTLRTDERLSQAGGNVHYERFIEEVLPKLSSTDGFSYTKFDCSIMDFNGIVNIGPSAVKIVEGSYSCHPKLGKYADLTVFSDCAPQEQMRRIQKRNGEKMAEMFRTKWIPMEENYFAHFSISENADIHI